jgi:adenosine deaminase
VRAGKRARVRPSIGAMSSDVVARALPKVVLHEHLDGALRVGTLLALLHERGIEPPAGAGADEAALSRWFDANAHAGSLERYLEGFGLTVAAMASPAALERVAFEVAEDARADGAVLAEFRIAPLLFEPFGIAGEEAIEALLAGLAHTTCRRRKRCARRGSRCGTQGAA